MNMYDAPYEQLLKLTAIPDQELAEELSRMGLRIGTEFHKHLSKIPQSMRIKTPNGSVLLGGRLAQKIFVKCENETKLLDKILFQDKAVIETLKGGKAFQSTVGKLGLSAGIEIQLMHRLPKMEFVIRINGQSRIKINEMRAARILGCHEDGKTIQLSAARVLMSFSVTDIIGGGKSTAFLKELGITKNSQLILEGVEASKDIFYSQASKKSDICIKLKQSGVRIHLDKNKTKLLTVRLV